MPKFEFCNMKRTILQCHTCNRNLKNFKLLFPVVSADIIKKFVTIEPKFTKYANCKNYKGPKL